MSKEPLLLTLPLTDFVDSHLGRGLDEQGKVRHLWHSRPIAKHLATIIYALTKNEHTCCIQWADQYNPELREPVLWEYGAWINSTEKWMRAKVRSDMERVERNILAANTKIVAKAWADFSGVNVREAEVVAYRLLSGNNSTGIRVFYEGKLITKEEEL